VRRVAGADTQAARVQAEFADSPAGPTVIAQADAAIGGKGSADFEGVKNLVGAFYHPAAVIIDPALLATLGERHVSHGLAEIVKVAVISDLALFEMLEEAPAITPEVLGEATGVRSAPSRTCSPPAHWSAVRWHAP
jgi:3-dehydroquinate synthetase